MMALPQRISYPLPVALPANTVAWQMDPARSVLLIHDMQQYFLRGFATDADPLPAVIANIAELRAAAVAAGVPVLYTAQPGVQDRQSRGLLTDFWGAGITGDPADTSITPALAPTAEDVVLVKHRYSATVRTDLLDRLATMGRDQVVITGVYAHIGCLVTAIDLFMADVQSFVVADAVADFSAADHASALQYVARRCGVVVDTGSAVTSLTGRLLDRSAEDDSMDWLAAEISELIGRPGELPDRTEDLFEMGLDSVRAMALIDRIGDRGISIDMVDLLADPTLTGLQGCVERAREGAGRTSYAATRAHAAV